MPIWIPQEKWKDEDVFIIGGGDSLRTFNFDVLKDELTIGCNTAFSLGSDICKICIFGDQKWYAHFLKDLPKYEGVLFTNAPQLKKASLRIPWLWYINRKERGLHFDALGWNGNTGASAINLALLLGAKRVFLLGFDMHLSSIGRPNWHDDIIDKPNENCYVRFLSKFKRVEVDLKKKFPNREVINISDSSGLDLFPIVGVDEFWKNRKAS